jgi:hypothetical protein
MATHSTGDTKATPPSPGQEKADVAQLEQVSTHDDPPVKEQYAEEGKLRTEGMSGPALL